MADMQNPLDFFTPIDKLDLYIHDYLAKNNNAECAAVFAQIRNLDLQQRLEIDIPGGYLKKWLSDFCRARAQENNTPTNISSLITAEVGQQGEPSGNNARLQQQDRDGIGESERPAYQNGNAVVEEIEDNIEIISNALDFSLKQTGFIRPTKRKLTCFQASPDRVFLVSGGHEMKVMKWNARKGKYEFAEMKEEHADTITDLRFRPDSSSEFATSSFDRTILLWDATKSSKSVFKFEGHGEKVMSLDFNAKVTNLLCSCDSNDEIRFWNLSYDKPHCVRTFQGGNKQVMFEPQNGQLLAAASGSTLNLIDVETNRILKKFEGHIKEIRSLCWDMSGNYIASVSEDGARVWCVSSGICEQELSSKGGHVFECCTFHHSYEKVLVIGSCQSLVLWDAKKNNIATTVDAHDDKISHLSCTRKGIVASASHDTWVKFWK